MLPTLRQRLLLGLSLVIGTIVWLQAVPALRADDLSAGLSIVDASGGPGSAILAVVLAGLPAVVLALACASAGNPASGPFVIAFCLSFVAVTGGPIDGVIRRAHSADALSGLYPRMALELASWAVALFGLMLAMHAARPLLRRVLPGWLVSHDAPAGRWQASLGRPGRAGAIAALVTAASGGLLAMVLIRSADTGQVVGGLVLAFTIAGAMGRMLVNDRRVLGVLLSPCLVGIAGYLWVARSNPDGSILIARYYAGDLSPLGHVLPIYYASAGVLGASLGVGIGQGLLVGSHAARVQARLSNPAAQGEDTGATSGPSA